MVETLAGEDGDLGLGQVEPTACLGVSRQMKRLSSRRACSAGKASYSEAGLCVLRLFWTRRICLVACLGRRYGSAVLRAALMVLVAVLMGFNAIGAYGFLAKAHIGHAVAGERAVAGRAVDIDARLNVQAGIVADLDRRIAQIDGAVEKATAKAGLARR
jgi:hypothetical protein